jgi:hypothetical protein
MSTKQSELGVRKIDPEEVITHHYEDGKSACPISEEHGSPLTWPAGNSYSSLWMDVTCEKCQEHKPEAVSP